MTASLDGIFERMAAALTRAAFEEGHTIWLFFGSDGGGATAAVLASFTETCQRHAINPRPYLADVLTRLPSRPVEQLANFLPDRWATTHFCLRRSHGSH
jgi:hypothetical protein